MADVGCQWVWERHSTRASGALVHWHDSLADLTIFKLRPSGPGRPGSARGEHSQPEPAGQGQRAPGPAHTSRALKPLRYVWPRPGGPGSLQLATAQWRGRGAGQRPAQAPRRRTRRARLGPQLALRIWRLLGLRLGLGPWH